MRGLNLGVQTGLDPDPASTVAVGTFGYTPVGAPPQQVRSQVLHASLTSEPAMCMCHLHPGYGRALLSKPKLIDKVKGSSHVCTAHRWPA